MTYRTPGASPRTAVSDKPFDSVESPFWHYAQPGEADLQIPVDKPFEEPVVRFLPSQKAARNEQPVYKDQPALC